MREIVTFDAREIAPEPEALLTAQGMGAASSGAGVSAAPSERTSELCRQAVALFAQHAAPVGVLSEIAAALFASVYEGDGENAPRTPLAEVYPHADVLALFAVTVGPALGARIAALFASRDFALATLLDAAASEGAERTADAAQRLWQERLQSRGSADVATRVLHYSPGYCGWHVSGQRALFAVLRPEEIGITLRESCLMEPLKSISGVMAAGPGRIHVFDDDYEFCADCATRSCRTRIAGALEG